MPDAETRILLVDDDLDMHEVVKLILQPLGYQVKCCATTGAGLAALQAERPDLLLLDIMLATPTEGLELGRRLREDPVFAALPVILISSAARDMAQVEQVQAAAFLEKPLDAKALRDAVAGALCRCIE